MSADLVSIVQAIIQDQLRGFPTAELGIVTQAYPHEAEADANNYECDVRLRDSGLELKRVPVSTTRIGAAAIPDKDDLVLVQYLNGDRHQAVITGRLYNDQDRPPQAKPHEFVYGSPYRPESGIRRIYLELPNGNQLTVDDDRLTLEMGSSRLIVNHTGDIEIRTDSSKITLADQAGKNQLEIQPQAGQVKIMGQVKVVVEAQQIELVQGAAHPLVFGDSLLQYLNQLVSIFQSHIHPGEMAAGIFPVVPTPPVPPFPPATPDLLSFKVKTG